LTTKFHVTRYKADISRNVDKILTDKCKTALIKVKVKVTLEQVTKAQMWSRGIAPFFL
jgi:hypothetical protein